MIEALTNQAHEYLYNKIISYEYLSGQELNERRLLEEASLGRTPLREALFTLRSEGLIEVLSYKGMRITVLTEEGIDDLYQARKLIEPTVCRKYITPYSRSHLLEFQKVFKRAEDTSDVGEYRIDTSFHSYLISITNNNILVNIYHSIMIHQMCMTMYAAMQNSSNRVGNLKQHKAIIDTLLRENEGDVQDAIVLYTNHSLIKSLKLL